MTTRLLIVNFGTKGVVLEKDGHHSQALFAGGYMGDIYVWDGAPITIREMKDEVEGGGKDEPKREISDPTSGR